VSERGSLLLPKPLVVDADVAVVVVEGREEEELSGCLRLLEPSSEWSEPGLTTMRLRFLALNMRVSSDIVLCSEGGREGDGVDGEDRGD
jgi:hypothetical protein